MQERAFGLLTARFGILWRELRVAHPKISTIVQACCVLHNLYIDDFGLTQPQVDEQFQKDMGFYLPEVHDNPPPEVTDRAGSTMRELLRKELEKRKMKRPSRSSFSYC